MKSSIFQGRYLFHFHTQATDGQLSVGDYFDFAVNTGIEALVFLEHIRRNPTYDVEGLIQQIQHAARNTQIRAVVGFETKVLPDGSIDIADQHFAMADVIGLAEHGSPASAELAECALRHALTTYPSSFPAKQFVWVHPGLWHQRFTSSLALHEPYLGLLRTAQEQGVLIEKNIRYGVVDEEVAPSLAPEALVTGADAHKDRDLLDWSSRMGLRKELPGSSAHSTPVSVEATSSV